MRLTDFFDKIGEREKKVGKKINFHAVGCRDCMAGCRCDFYISDKNWDICTNADYDKSYVMKGDIDNKNII